MRNTICDVVVLKTRRQGDYDKLVTLFGPGPGLLRASVYGAYRGKSRLSGSTEQFIRLKAYLYYNPVRDFWKLSDAEVIDQHRGIMDSLEKIMIASAGAELVMKTDAAGGETGLYSILLELFHSLDVLPEEHLQYLLVQFLWRYLGVSGDLPDLSVCPDCGRTLEPGDDIVYVSTGPGFLCSACVVPGGRCMPAGTRRYLLHTTGLSWEQAIKVRMTTSGAIEECESLLIDYVQATVETPIHSFQKGGQLP